MENITIAEIVTVIGIITVIGGFFGKCYSLYKKEIIDKFDNHEKRITELESNDKKQDDEINESKEERLLLIKSILACLKGLREQGCNGPVTEAINSIENYLIDKSH